MALEPGSIEWLLIASRSGDFLPHPEERRLRRVSKDGCVASWFETAQERLLTMRRDSHQIGLLRPSNNGVLGGAPTACNPAPACRAPGTGPSARTCPWSRCPWPTRP